MKKPYVRKTMSIADHEKEVATWKENVDILNTLVNEKDAELKDQEEAFGNMEHQFSETSNLLADEVGKVNGAKEHIEKLEFKISQKDAIINAMHPLIKKCKPIIIGLYVTTVALGGFCIYLLSV